MGFFCTVELCVSEKPKATFLAVSAEPEVLQRAGFVLNREVLLRLKAPLLFSAWQEEQLPSPLSDGLGLLIGVSEKLFCSIVTTNLSVSGHKK